MSNNSINDVRAALIATLDDLRDKANPMDIKRALAIAAVADSAISSARAETEYLKVTKQNRGSDFLEPPTETMRIAAHNPFPGVRRHRLEDDDDE